MNGRAAAKAVGVYLAILVPVGAWIGGTVWANVTGQSEDTRFAIGLAPFWVLGAFLTYFLFIHIPVESLYHHFNRKGGK